MKRLCKSNDRVICGVCGGVAKYFNIDPTIIRLIMVIITIFGIGTGIILYILAALIMPSSTDYSDNVDDLKSANVDNSEPAKTYNGNGAGNRNANGNSSARPDEEFNSYFKN